MSNQKLQPYHESKILRLHNEGRTLREIKEALASDMQNPVDVSMVAIHTMIKKYKTITVKEIIPELMEEATQQKMAIQENMTEQIKRITDLLRDKIAKLELKVANGEELKQREFYLLLQMLKTYSTLHSAIGSEVVVTQEQIFDNIQNTYLKRQKVETKEKN